MPVVDPKPIAEDITPYVEAESEEPAYLKEAIKLTEKEFMEAKKKKFAASTKGKKSEPIKKLD